MMGLQLEVRKESNAIAPALCGGRPEYLGTTVSGQTPQSAASEIAPLGKLRVGFQIGSPILAKRAPDGSVSGVVVDLGKFIADRLGVAFDPVVYANQEAYAQSFGRGEWDIVIGVSSALTREKTDTSPDFMLADAMYIAAPGRDFADVNCGRPTGRQGGGFPWRGLGSVPQLVRSSPRRSSAFRAGYPTRSTHCAPAPWMRAANPVTLKEIADALPGAKVVPGAWTTGRYAVSLPREHRRRPNAGWRRS